MSEELIQFYKNKATSANKKRYDYDEEGNLVKYNKEGGVIQTITLPTYRTPTFEEIDEMERLRIERIAAATIEFEHARVRLYEENEKPNQKKLRKQRTPLKLGKNLRPLK